MIANKKTSNSPYNWHRIITLMVLCLFAFTAILAARQRKRSPQRTAKVTDERIYLEHADELSYGYAGIDYGAQFLKGNVAIRHKGMHLTCDSAYLYNETNSFRALGHVHMTQGDTLDLVSERGYYDGFTEIAHAWDNVVLTHRTNILHCDTLDYDRLYDFADAYGSGGIKLTSNKDVLTSDWGRYHLDTRKADFYYNVVLTNDKGLRIETDTLHYYEPLSMANATGPSTILSNDNKVETSNGWYNTRTERSELYGRSTVYSGQRTITADSLWHDEASGINEGFGNVVYVDHQNKNSLISDYGKYNTITGDGFATQRALAIEFSQQDTLYMHGDTIRIHTIDNGTDSVQREVHAYPHVRMYRNDLQGVCDSLVFLSIDSCMTMYKDPVMWQQNNQLLGEKIKVYMNDSTVRYAEVLSQALSVQQYDSLRFNQIASRDMRAYFVDGQLRENWAVSNVQVVYYPVDDSDSTIIGLNYTETDTLKMFLTAERTLDRIWLSASTGTLYPLTQTPPDKHKLKNFAWLDYMRPRDKDDLYVWKPKSAELVLKEVKRREAPKRKIDPSQDNAQPQVEPPSDGNEPPSASEAQSPTDGNATPSGSEQPPSASEAQPQSEVTP